MNTITRLLRNPWPFALIGVFAVFITLIAMFITFAVAQDMDLVRPDYYAEELRFQDRIDSMNRTRRLDPPVTVRFNADRRTIDLSLPPVHGQLGPTGTVIFYRPSNARLDHRLPLRVEHSGGQTIPVNALEAGLWRIEVDWNHQGEAYHASQTVVISATAP